MNVNFNYSVPIKESFSENGDFIIKGTAINATTTDNGHTFLAEELNMSANTLIGAPLLVDHENKVENIKGKVIMSEFNQSANKVDFKAKVMDEKVSNMIKDGRLNSVSVGANVSSLEEGDNGDVIARGIKFKELSLVAVPADSGATFGIAMSEAYNLMKSKESNELESQSHSENLTELERGTSKMTEKIDRIDEVLEAIKSVKEELVKDFTEKLDVIKEEMKPVVVEADVDEPKEPEEPKKEEKEEPETVEPEVEAEAEADVEAEESSKYNIAEGVGSIKGNSFTYTW